jgi:(p)ppGpp synthase/HD superfamily hydrolase
MWTKKINEAIEVATTLHQGQVRKDGYTPYIAHPMAVALIVNEYTDDEDVVIAALLHDILEDVDEDDYGVMNMKSQFGERVLKLVQAVSEPQDFNISRKDSWKERKLAYLKHLETADEGALLISAADLYHNMHSYLELEKHNLDNKNAKFNAGLEDRIWFAKERVRIITDKFNSPFVAELQRLLDVYLDVLASS